MTTCSDPAAEEIYQIRTRAEGPSGRLPLTEDMLLNSPSGDLFGLTQNAGMGWNPADVARASFLILSTRGGLRAADGAPIALGYHTGHWEIGLLVRAAAEEFRRLGRVPFAGFCSDPCDGRTQGSSIRNAMVVHAAFGGSTNLLLHVIWRRIPCSRTTLVCGRHCSLQAAARGVAASTIRIASLPPCVSESSTLHPPSGRGRRPCPKDDWKERAQRPPDRRADSSGRRAASASWPMPCSQAVQE